MPRIHGATVRVAAWNSASPLHPLLGRVVTELAEALPVGGIPKKLPCALELSGVAAALRFLQPWGDLVVNNRSGNRTQCGRTHRAVREQTQVPFAGLLPLVPVPAFRATAATFIALIGHRQKPHARQVAWRPSVRTTQWQRQRPPLLSGIQVRQMSRSTYPPRTAA